MCNLKETLETERLILRKPTPDDFEAFHSWCANPKNTRYMSFGPNTEEQTREWLLQAKPCKDFAIVLKETGAVIGSCGIHPNEVNYMGELGWILHKDYWKRGYGTELGGELIRYGFEDLKLGRIQAPCAAVNYGSYRVMERNGMRREALRRKAFWARLDKEWIDGALYAILAEDYYAKKSLAYIIGEIDPVLREKIQPILDKSWGAPEILINGKLWDSRVMPGLVATGENGDIYGYLLYAFHDGECEIMVLESVIQNVGVASALIDELKKIAKRGNVGKIIVQTTNDNTHAIRFYQRRGFVIRAIRIGALDAARQLKPSIPLLGNDGISLRDEIEFEIPIL